MTAPRVSGVVFNADYAGTRWRYGLVFRPVMLGTVPRGFVIGSEGPATARCRFGTIDYPFELAADEVRAYELVALGKQEGRAAS